MLTTDAERVAAELSDRYTVEEVLGQGSYAMVFLALDRRHQRHVALKVLSVAAGEKLGTERFEREILTLARLQHPHILPLFDSGVAAGRLWFTMPFVEAGSLRDRLKAHGPMSQAEATQLGTELGEALAYAHAHGVIHRDIKPENIMFSAEGHALLADFGLARATDQELSPSVTDAGVAVGTPLYMSPEEAGGEGADERSDVYGLGSVVYEALTGEPPFAGTNARAVMTRRLVEPPPSARSRRPEVSKAVDAALLKALARHPEQRFATPAEFASALAGPAAVRTADRLRWWAVVALMLVAIAAAGSLLWRSRRAPPVAEDSSIPVLAVLPFKNLGPPEEQYFADGLTEEITSRLAGLSGLRVISRTSADQYRNAAKPLRDIGRELGAAYVLEGSVRWERTPGTPGRVRVTPQLIRVADDSHLWADAYDAELTRIFALQASIAEQVTGALDLALRPPERTALVEGGTADAEAYDYYLQANDYLGRGNARATLATAAELYEKAVSRDPRFALAFARLSNARSQMYWYHHEARTPALIALAKRAADSALALVPDLAEGQTALGYYHYRGFRDYAQALVHFERARRRQPHNTELLAGIGYVERRRGRWNEAIAAFAEAARSDPRSNVRAFDLGTSLNAVRRFAEAERELDRAITLAPDWASPYGEKAQLLLIARGDAAGARAVIRQALDRVGLGPLSRSVFSTDQIVGPLFSSDSATGPLVDSLRLQGFAGDTMHYYFLKTESALFRERAAAGRGYADSLREVLERGLRTGPGDAYDLHRLAFAYAALGRKVEAVRAARRSVELMPVSRDALIGPYFVVGLARTYMMVGELDRAVETLAPLLDVPSPITRAGLAADPLWAPLRENPGFQKLIAEVRQPAE